MIDLYLDSHTAPDPRKSPGGIKRPYEGRRRLSKAIESLKRHLNTTPDPKKHPGGLYRDFEPLDPTKAPEGFEGPFAAT